MNELQLIRNNQLDVLLPFSNIEYINNWSDVLERSNPKLLKIIKSKHFNVRDPSKWYANNCIFKTYIVGLKKPFKCYISEGHKTVIPFKYFLIGFIKYINKYDPTVDLNEVVTDGTHKEDWLDVGFLAQDVADIEASYDYKIIDKTNLTTSCSNDGKQYGTKYNKFVPMLVKAVQELSAKVKALEDAQ